MRVIRFLTAVSLSVGLAFSASTALAGGENDDRVVGGYAFTDNKCADKDTDNQKGGGIQAFVIDGDSLFLAAGVATGVGTGGDDVTLVVVTDSVNNASGHSSSPRWCSCR